jgi:hypothetical protein
MKNYEIFSNVMDKEKYTKSREKIDYFFNDKCNTITSVKVLNKQISETLKSI